MLTADGDAATVQRAAVAEDRWAEAFARRRRVHVIRRLIDQGMTVRALEAILPGWEETIAAALRAERL